MLMDKCWHFSNCTIMNKSKQGSHSKYEIVSIIFTYPTTNPSPPPPQIKCDGITWLIWPNQKLQTLLSFYRSWNAVNKQYISQFLFLKLTNQIKFKFSFCLILHLKPFCPSEYINFFGRGDLQWAHFLGHPFPVRNDISHAEQELQ